MGRVACYWGLGSAPPYTDSLPCWPRLQAAAARGWWEVWRCCRVGGGKITWWVKVCAGCQMSGLFSLASLSTPGSSWRPACVYLQLVFNGPSLSILETFNSSEWRRLNYIHYYISKPIVSSGSLSLDPPPFQAT